MIGRLLCRLGWHRYLGNLGPFPGIALLFVCTRCGHTVQRDFPPEG